MANKNVATKAAGKSVKKAAKKEKADAAPQAAEVPVVVDEPDSPKGTEGKRARPKCGREVEISLKVPGYHPTAKRVVDIDRLDAAERASLFDELIDEINALF